VKLDRYAALRLMKLFILAAMAIPLATNPTLFSQPSTVSLCIVDTRLAQMGLYDPPAGPFATGMYQQLDGRRLKNGSKLHIIVFPASMQSDIVSEVHRLNCSWVLQLRYRQQLDDDVFGQTYPRGTRLDSLLFTLWNGATGKVLESGGGFVSLREPLLTPYVSFRKQVLKALNQLR
jgi:hypothetical protein